MKRVCEFVQTICKRGSKKRHFLGILPSRLAAIMKMNNAIKKNVTISGRRKNLWLEASTETINTVTVARVAFFVKTAALTNANAEAMHRVLRRTAAENPNELTVKYRARQYSQRSSIQT